MRPISEAPNRFERLRWKPNMLPQLRSAYVSTYLAIADKGSLSVETLQLHLEAGFAYFAELTGIGIRKSFDEKKERELYAPYHKHYQGKSSRYFNAEWGETEQEKLQNMARFC